MKKLLLPPVFALLCLSSHAQENRITIDAGASLGIWIVSAKSDFEGKAAVVYVGEKLGDEAAATVYVNDETVKFEQTATPFSATVTGDLGAAAKVTAEAADKNAVVTI